MPSSKKPRKPMKHRPAALPILIRTPEEDDRNLKLIPHQELDLLRRGQGTGTSWNTIAVRINLGSVLSMKHEWTDDPQPVMRAGLDALRSLMARQERTGKYVATGDELRALGDALKLTDDMQDATTRRHHRDAMRLVMETAT